MKYVADRGYTDLKLNRHVEKGAVLEEEYKKENIELTEERKDYLVNERKLYIAVEEIPDGRVGDITPVDKVPEGTTVVDGANIVEDNNEEEKAEEKEVTEPKEEKQEDSEEESNKEDNEEESNSASEEESNKEDRKEEKTNVKSNAKTNMKTTKKSEEK